MVPEPVTLNDPEHPDCIMVGPFNAYPDADEYCRAQKGQGVQMDIDGRYFVYGLANRITIQRRKIQLQLSLF